MAITHVHRAGLRSGPGPSDYRTDHEVEDGTITLGMCAQDVLDAFPQSGPHTHNADDINAGTLAATRLPVATTAARGAAQVDHDGAGSPVALTTAGHGLAADPHPQYALDTEKGAASGIATLDGIGLLEAGQLPLGASG